MPTDHPPVLPTLRADIASWPPDLRQALVRDARILLLPPDPSELAQAPCLEGWFFVDDVPDGPRGLLRLEGRPALSGWGEVTVSGIVLALRCTDRCARLDGRWVRLGEAGRPEDEARLDAIEASLDALRAALLEERP